MARVTVEDCVTKIPNRFELVMLASQRARDISAGAEPTVEEDNDRHPVIALREIADGTVTGEQLSETLVQGLQRYAEIDEPEEAPLKLVAAAEALFGPPVAAAVDPAAPPPMPTDAPQPDIAPPPPAAEPSVDPSSVDDAPAHARRGAPGVAPPPAAEPSPPADPPPPAAAPPATEDAGGEG